MGSESSSGKTVKAVEQTIDIVGELRENAPMTVTALSETLDIPTSTAHLHLKTLQNAGYAVNDDGSYRLSLRFLRDGIVIRSNNRLFNVAADEIDAIASSTAEVSALGVEEDGQRVLIYQAEGEEAVYDNAPTGEFTNMHWSALGKAMLAHLPEEQVTDIVDIHGLPEQTEQTITDRHSLRAELRDIEQQGYSLEDEERREGIRSIAVPVIVDEQVVGAVSISGPKNRIYKERIQDELLPTLQDATNVIEVKYVY